MQTRERGSRIYLLRAVYSPSAKRAREFFFGAADATTLVLEPTELPEKLPEGWEFLEAQRATWSAFQTPKKGEPEAAAWDRFCADRKAVVRVGEEETVLGGLCESLERFLSVLRLTPSRALHNEQKWVSALTAARAEIQDMARLQKRKEKAIQRVEESEAARQAKKAAPTTPQATSTD